MPDPADLVLTNANLSSFGPNRVVARDSEFCILPLIGHSIWQGTAIRTKDLGRWAEASLSATPPPLGRSEVAEVAHFSVLTAQSPVE